MIYSAFISLSSPKVVEKETKWSKPNKLSPDWTLWRSSASPLKLLYDQENWMQYGSKMFFGIGTPMVFWSSPPCHWIGGNNLAILGKSLSYFLTFNRGVTKYHGGLRTDVYQCNQGSYAKPLCYASVILSLAVVVGESLSLSQICKPNAKAAATGFERETKGNLLSLSNSSSRTKQSRPPWPTSPALTFSMV